LQEMIDTAKSALTAEDLTQEYADQFVELLQNAIDSLEENKNTSEIDITSLKNLISYANTLIQDDESYSQEGIEILKSEISSTEKLCESITTQDELSQAEWELVKAIGKLQSTAIANIDLEDGYYETSVSYYCAYYNHELQMYTLKDGTSEYELMKNILGSTIRFKVEDGVYTIMFEPQICEDSDWYYNSFSSNLGPCKDSEFNMTTQTIEYYDREINIINPEDYVMCRTMDQPYTYKSGKYIEMNGYCKSEETEYAKNITQIDFDDDTLPYWESAFIDIDWENAVKTADLVVDKSELAKELEFAEYMFTTDLSMYTDASVEDYKEAYDAAKAVYDNESVKQSEVKAAVQSLSDASYNLVKNDAYLTAKILEASAIEKDNISDEKWTVLQTAIAEANSVLENENSTQAELQAQIENLSEAVAAVLSPNVDVAALEAKLSEAKAISNDDGKYTADSFAVLEQYIAIAEPAVTADDLTQETADQLVILLQNAIDGLIETTVSVDTSALEAKIAEAEVINNDENKYTAESYNALQEMIDTAKSALTAEDLTQEYADAFVGLIQNSIDGLEENLPQTGNNSLFNLSVILGAFALIGAGLITMFKSGIVRRKKNC
ncbi:MAG: LPXTG cell wall anchor domain-containing protein, partial [Clostridiales bacterium]|nr:LPXTG cell wall anchor domain-containing protein [Clostridiales bacterium]